MNNKSDYIQEAHQIIIYPFQRGALSWPIQLFLIDAIHSRTWKGFIQAKDKLGLTSTK